ncbi:MAG: crosslink repair DNA glycosylase YcaQ family protein [Chloroflexota bacterium]
MAKPLISQLGKEQLRRFILGKQGLWPGRRWSGIEGLSTALHAAEAVQIDPVSIVAPSNDIVLWGRVDGYQPAHLHELLYQKRQFFDHGGALFIYPMSELPYWRVMMERRKSQRRWRDFASANPGLLEVVRAELRHRGPLRNRDLKGKAVQHYRGSKETSVALYYLWLTGELLTYSRDGKERVYDFLENVAPKHLQFVAAPEEAEEFLTQKSIRQWGVITPRLYRAFRKEVTGRAIDTVQAKVELAERVEIGQLLGVSVEGSKTLHYLLADDLPLIEAVVDDRVPDSWIPFDITTHEEIIFLSPLEYVSARGRAKELFDFDYIWEIYKPAAKRHYGPYTLPILFGDQLVARIDAKLERAEKRLVVNGFWLEEWVEPDEQFRVALNRGLARFMTFLGASTADDIQW